MFKTKATRLLILVFLGLALALGAVGAYAAVQDSGSSQSINQQDSQQGDDPENEDAEDDAGRPWIGVALAPNRGGDGLVILHVVPGGPADEAGLEQGDVITAADGADVSDVEDVRDAIADKAPGDTVTLSVIREDGDGAAEDISVTLGEAPSHRWFKGPIGDLLEGGFQQFLGGEFRYEDDEGNVVTVEAIPGTVTSIGDTSITIDVNGDEGERTFDLGDSVEVPARLEEGDPAIVVLKDGEPAAVLPGLGKLGIPGFAPGPFPFRGPRFDGFDKFPLPHDFRDWLPDNQPQEGSAGPDA